MAGELFVSSGNQGAINLVDNSSAENSLLRAIINNIANKQALDVATGHIDLAAILELRKQWSGCPMRVLMGDAHVPLRLKSAFDHALTMIRREVDQGLDVAKVAGNDFLDGVEELATDLRTGRLQFRVYRDARFHAKAYIVRDTDQGRPASASRAFVGSSNLTLPGLTQNVELNVDHAGKPAQQVADWFDKYWEQSEDITPEIAAVVDRQIEQFTPFHAYAKSLQQLFLGYELSTSEWEKAVGPDGSKIYKILDDYQREGYHQLVKIASKYRGAFLCDGVGLGKTFMGLMLIERLAIKERKNVVLLVPKAARQPVWESAIAKYLPHLDAGDFGRRLTIYNHTDLIRAKSKDRDYPKIFAQLANEADAFIIDEAHHFRNPGLAGEGQRRPSRYRKLFDICGGKQMFLLTATPVNNRLIDLQHMVELFSRKEPDYFFQRDPSLGIHSLPGHFRKMERELDAMLAQQAGHHDLDDIQINLVEAERVLADDRLFRSIVVQRSRAYVRQSQLNKSANPAIFPTREAPQVAKYELKKTYGRLLDMVEKAFMKKKALFALPIYSPESYLRVEAPKSEKAADEPFAGATKGRQEQIVGLIRTSFLKRFESSAQAFTASCESLLRKLLAWVEVHSEDDAHQKRRFERWKQTHSDIVDPVDRQQTLFDEEPEEDDIDFVPQDMIDAVEKLDPKIYKVEEMLDEAYSDLDQLQEFLRELRKFEPKHDDKLKSLIKLLKTDPVLKKHKVLIFSEFMDTARYLKQQLELAGIDGVDEIDSAVKRDRGEMIREFAPYYNGSSSAQLADLGFKESRVLISTDVLSEGLNLQDATRLINYDLHWNPVRLMQRIGRVDRRMNLEIEKQILADHPDQKDVRGKVTYWNFLPPDELNRLLTLYQRVTHKTLRISMTFGIEGKKLLTPDDDYQALKDFTESYEGTMTPVEELRSEYQQLLKAHPSLEAKLDAMPSRAFSGKEHPAADAQGVFFCYALPGRPSPDQAASLLEPTAWTEVAGEVRWYYHDLLTGKISEDVGEIAKAIRSNPQTPRKTEIERTTLGEIRLKVEKHIKNSYLKAAQAPVGVKPILKVWMELN